MDFTESCHTTMNSTYGNMYELVDAIFQGEKKNNKYDSFLLIYKYSENIIYL